MKGLTKKQREILDFIQSYSNQHRHAPSYRDILTYFGFSSTASVFKHVQALRRKGALDLEKHVARSIHLSQNANEKSLSGMIELPLEGLLTANCARLPYPAKENIRLPPLLVPNPAKSYLLKVQGDAYQIEEQICDGDLLIIEEKTQVLNGETALLLINKQEVLLKRFFQEGYYLRLESANPTFAPLKLRPESVRILGVLISLLRNY